jgi:hypothetical protein
LNEHDLLSDHVNSILSFLGDVLDVERCIRQVSGVSKLNAFTRVSTKFVSNDGESIPRNRFFIARESRDIDTSFLELLEGSELVGGKGDVPREVVTR